MKKFYLIGLSLVILSGWFVIPAVAFSNSTMVDGWITYVPENYREKYVYKILLEKDEPNFVKVALMESWLQDIEAQGGKFGIKEYSPLVGLSKSDGEPLSQPIGLLAAKLIIHSKDCTANAKLLELYRDDKTSLAWLVENSQKYGKGSCS